MLLDIDVTELLSLNFDEDENKENTVGQFRFLSCCQMNF